MECTKCNYKGPPEYGDYNLLLFNAHVRCPNCKSFSVIVSTLEGIEEFLKYPTFCRGPEKHHVLTRNKLVLLPPNPSGGLAAYSIHCPVCEWGHGGGLAVEDYRYLVGAGAQKE